MMTLVVSVFLASLLGSLHCAGMCGAFLAVAIHSPGEKKIARWRPQAAYHLGRLITYVALGIAAGTAGALLNLGSTLTGVGPIAASIAGATMIVFGLVTVLRYAGVSVPRFRPPVFMQATLMRGHQFATRFGPMARASLIGLFTTLLPCGWLYAFAVVAAGTASPLVGGLVMIVFWAGTLPILIALGTGVQQLLGSLGKRMPLITSLAVIAAGAYTLSGRAMMNVNRIAARTHDPLAHLSATTESSGSVSTVDSTPACCVKE
jgi:sulfite exporter TauE/SafE